MKQYTTLMNEYKSFLKELEDAIKSERNILLKRIYINMRSEHKTSYAFRGIKGNIEDIKVKLEIIKRKKS